MKITKLFLILSLLTVTSFAETAPPDQTNDDATNNIVGYGGLILAVAALFISIYASYQAKSQARAATALECLNVYLEISKDEKFGVDKSYFRKLLDLHCTEYHLWKKNYIDHALMAAWCEVRRSEYRDKTSEYGKTWDLLKTTYFSPDENFCNFMDKIHGNEDIMQILKKTKKINN